MDPETKTSGTQDVVLYYSEGWNRPGRLKVVVPNGSVEDIFQIEGFRALQIHLGPMTDVLLCPTLASHDTLLAPPPLKIIVIKNLIVIFQALCILQDVWPPMNAARNFIQDAYYGLEKTLSSIFSIEKLRGDRKHGNLVRAIITMYTNARRDERRSWETKGSPPVATDSLVCLLHKLVDEWIRFSDSGRPLHPIRLSHKEDRPALLKLRHFVMETYVSYQVRIGEIFHTMWFWIDKKNRKRVRPPLTIKKPANLARLVKKRKARKNKKSLEQAIEDGVTKFGHLMEDIANVNDVTKNFFDLPIRPKP